MLKAAEQWRKEFGVDELVQYVHRSSHLSPCTDLAARNFDFKEKAEVDKYYPQYYHKMDKVGTFPAAYSSPALTSHTSPSRKGDQYT